MRAEHQPGYTQDLLEPPEAAEGEEGEGAPSEPHNRPLLTKFQPLPLPCARHMLGLTAALRVSEDNEAQNGLVTSKVSSQETQ